jgi:hypothetical protein
VINNTGTPHLQDGKAVKLGNNNPDLMSRLGQGAKEFVSNLRPRTNMSRTAIVISDVSANSRDSITVTPDIKGGAEFHPIGQYIFLNQNGKNDVHRVDGSSAEMSELLKISQFDRAAWERHKAARYKEALIGSEDSAQPRPLTTVVKRPLPVVSEQLLLILNLRILKCQYRCQWLILAMVEGSQIAATNMSISLH